MAVVKINKRLGLVFGIVLSALLLFTGTSCEQEDLEPRYPFTIVVKSLEDSTRLNNVFVEVLAPIPDSQVYLTGYTSERGSIRFTYNSAAVLLVRATRGDKPDYTWIGCTEVRLKPNEQVSKTVYLQPYDPQVEGCAL